MSANIVCWTFCVVIAYDDVPLFPPKYNKNEDVDAAVDVKAFKAYDDVPFGNPWYIKYDAVFDALELLFNANDDVNEYDALIALSDWLESCANEDTDEDNA